MPSPSVQWCDAPDLARPAVVGFRSRHRHDAVAVGRAPGRVNLVGDHTDYLGGLCLPLPLPHATWVAWAPRDDGQHRFTSTGHEDWSAPVGAPATGWASYVSAALAAVGVATDGGSTVHVESTVPVGAGLASSAALICAVGVAASETSPEGLVGPTIEAEQHGVGAPTGGLDQTVALLATPGNALLLDFGTGRRDHVPWRPERHDVELLVVDTRTRHSHATGGYGDRRAEGEAALRHPGSSDPLLRRRGRHVRSENERVRRVVSALAQEDWPSVGHLLTASHTSLRDDYEVSCPELDVAVEAALGGGALGARLTGGGFGGCVLVLVRRDRQEQVLSSVGSAFLDRGWTVPRVLRTAGGLPAARL